MKEGVRLKRKSGFQKKNIIFVFTLLVVFMVIGSLFDYPISMFLFNSQSIFGKVLASYGQAPAALCMSLSGILLVYNANRCKRISMILSYIASILLTLFAIFMLTVDPLLYLESMPKILSLCIAIIIVIISDVMMIRLVKEAPKEDITKFIILLIVTMVCALLIINVMKVFWGRPRMRMIAVVEEAQFQPWWVIGSQAKDYFMSLGIASEEFKSFPSGHSANAVCAILLGALPLLSQKLQGKEDILFYIGLIFTLLVAFSRIIMGAHFVTDITVGIAVTFIVETITIDILWRKKV